MNIKIIIIFACLILLAVISLYAFQFGLGLWNEHEKWAELGSFFGGVLGPIFAFFSLLYLAFQVEMQRKENRASRIESELNNRENYISTYLMMLTPKLLAVDTILKAPLAELILKIHRDKSLIENNIFDLKLGLSARGEAMVVWINISLALSYLKANDEVRYLNQLTLVTVQVGQELCSAMDKVAALATNIKFEHHFQ